MPHTENIILCVDLGGTHCSSGLVHGSPAVVMDGSYFRGNVNSNAERVQILSAIKQTIDKTLSSTTHLPSEIFISCPGPFDYENGISLMDGMNKYQSLLGFNLKTFFANITGIDLSSIYFYNDAAAFLLGEVVNKKMENRRVIGLTLGTGLGSSLYENGTIVDLNLGSAVFSNGIVEDFISTRGVLAHLTEKFGYIPVDNIKDIAERPDLEIFRKEAFDFLSKQLITFIKEYIYPLTPDTIIIGGSIAKAHNYFFDKLLCTLDTELSLASFDERNLFLGLTLKTFSI
ncbi:ROK family protein [Sphingobacterium multivorum]|uniref:ROK family protein n=1 Tax=Sphingobacterium multivorum TaxID=28454 RepID=UPI000ECB65EF|nr:hypothetical protein [Sphingobacterium sp.]